MAGVALVIDDLASVQPWAPRFLRLYGTAALVDRAGPSGPTRILKITPTVSWSVTLSGAALDHSGGGPSRTRTVHDAPVSRLEGGPAPGARPAHRRRAATIHP